VTHKNNIKFMQKNSDKAIDPQSVLLDSHHMKSNV